MNTFYVASSVFLLIFSLAMIAYTMYHGKMGMGSFAFWCLAVSNLVTGLIIH